jgi:hypothetical protein
MVRMSGPAGGWHATIHELPSLRETANAEGLRPSDQMTLSLTGKFVAVGRPFQVYSMARKQVVAELAGRREDTSTIAFTDDERFLISGSYEGTLSVWELATGKQVHSLATDKQPIADLAVSPTRLVLATATWNQSKVPQPIKFWNLTTGQQIAAIPGKDICPTSLAYSPDGSQLVTGMADTTALVWDVPAEAKGVRLASVPIPPADLTNVWKDLASTNAQTGQQAVLRLAQDPSAALRLAEQELRPAVFMEKREVQSLIDGLSAETFEERQRAEQQLEALGDRAMPILEAEIRETTDVRVRRVGEALLIRMKSDCPLPASALLNARAVQVLEWIGDARAIALLAKIAAGEKQLYLTQAAAGALGRVKEER